MKRLVNNALAVSALAAGLSLVAAPAQADVFLDFAVVETVVPGANSAVLDPVDKINGAYSERITFDGLGGFETHAIADFTQYLRDEGGTPVSSQLNVPPDGPCGGAGQPECPTLNQYGIYAIFTSDGTVSPMGPGFFQFSGGNGSVRVFIDPNLDTTKTLGATGGSAPIIAGNADDIEIMFANDLDSAFGILTPIGGFFDLVFRDPTLTAFGATYWVNLPPPGTFRANIDGDFDTFVPAGTLTLTGDVSNVFIPEPATLALLSSGLFAAGVAARRRRKAQKQ